MNDWEKKTLPTEVSDKCRELFTEAVGEGWREVAGTIIMDKDNTVVGFRMHLVRNGESKEVVVPASPELSEKMDIRTEAQKQMTEMLKVVSENPPPKLNLQKIADEHGEEILEAKKNAGILLERKNPWVK